jgi:hypothetical protein
MNQQNWLDLIDRIPAAMDAAEKLLPEANSGPSKLALITNAIIPLIPLAEASPKVQAIQAWMSALVGIYNAIGKYSSNTQTPTAPAAATDTTSVNLDDTN